MERKIRKYRLVFILLLTILSVTCRAQDPQFSQFYAHSLYLNPAFTGNTVHGRAMLGYRNQWPGISNQTYVTYAAAYDQNLPLIKSGAGFIMLYDRAGTGALSFMNMGGLFSKTIRLTKKVFLRSGAHASYTFRNIDMNKLTFGDELLNGSGNTISKMTDVGVGYLDFNLGALLYTKEMWLGVATHHINQPQQSLIGGDVRLPVKYSLHVGFRFLLTEDANYKEDNSIMLAFNYKAEDKWDQFDLGAYYKIKSFVAGMWYRGIPGYKQYDQGYSNHDAVVVIIGMKTEDYWIAYNYDVTISRLALHSAGSHEVSFTYEFASSRMDRMKAKGTLIVPCAKF